MIRITTPPSQDGKARIGWGTKITTAEGLPIDGIRTCAIRIEPTSIVTAEIEINVTGLDIEAHPLLGLDTLKAAAAQYGYRLEPLTGESA